MQKKTFQILLLNSSYNSWFNYC